MDSEKLYISCLKMINDKYGLKEYSKTDFISIYNNIYKEHNTTSPTNEINKLVLIKIKNDIENNTKKETQQVPLNLENKLKEIENIRTSMNIISSSIGLDDSIHNDDVIINSNQNTANPINSINSIQINNQDATIINKYKSFIINTAKNNLKITSTIDIKNNIIYPCCLCIPSDIKNKTPYLIISINDNIKNINYTYIPSVCNNIWDIWKPITDNYIDINLTTNHWNINIIDNYNNLIDLSYYNCNIIDVLEDNSHNHISLNIEKSNYFNVGDKIKIVKENGITIDSTIIDKITINNNIRIIIQKNNFTMEDFINATIFNYNHQLSLLFKYYAK